MFYIQCRNFKGILLKTLLKNYMYSARKVDTYPQASPGIFLINFALFKSRFKWVKLVYNGGGSHCYTGKNFLETIRQEKLKHMWQPIYVVYVHNC